MQTGHRTATRQDIWLLNHDQQLAVNLTDHPAVASDPARSPGGSRLAFVSTRSGNADLWVVNVDGTGLVQVTNNQGSVRFPSWSPDGSLIAYGASVDGQRDLYLIDAPDASGFIAAGNAAVASEPTRITDDPATDNEPQWLGAGRIAFFSTRGGARAVHLLNLVGTTPAGAPVRLSVAPAPSPRPICRPRSVTRARGRPSAARVTGRSSR